LFGGINVKKKLLIFFLIMLFSISLSNAIKTITVNETRLVSLKPVARDEDKDILSYSFTKPLDQDGKWQTDYGDAGQYKITITVSDGQSSTSEDVLLVVKKKNLPPEIDSFTPENLQLEIDEGQEISFNIKASDLNKDQLTYTWKFDNKILSQGPSYTYKSDYTDAGTHKIKVIISDGEAEKEQGWTIKINKVDRKALLDNFNDIEIDEGQTISLNLPDFKRYDLQHTISEPIGNDNIWETTYADDGTYNLKITIKDRKFTASKTIELKVNDKDRPPKLKPIANAWLKEGQKVTIELEANDPDDDKIELLAENLPQGAALKDNLFTWTTDYQSVKKEDMLDKTLDKFHLLYKSFKITFIAKSKKLESRQSVLIMIKDINQPPALKDPGTIVVNEGEEIILQPEATDPDGDTITYSYSGWIDIDRYQTNYDEAGTYKVKITASDGFLKDEKYATIEIKDVNRPPTLNKIDLIEINENQKLELPLYATDPEGDPVEITSDSLPEGATIKDNILIWQPDYDTLTTDSALFTINLIADDGKGQTTQQANITVYNINRKPKINSISHPRKITKDKKTKLEVSAEDPDGEELTYIWKFGLLEQYKAGPEIVRTFTSEGTKRITVIASDGKDETRHTFSIDVT